METPPVLHIGLWALSAFEHNLKKGTMTDITDEVGLMFNKNGMSKQFQIFDFQYRTRLRSWLGKQYKIQVRRISAS